MLARMYNSQSVQFLTNIRNGNPRLQIWWRNLKWLVLAIFLMMSGLYLLRLSASMRNRSLLGFYESPCCFNRFNSFTVRISDNDDAYCPKVPPLLQGNLTIADENISDDQALAASFLPVIPGGQWKPTDCEARQKVAIIIPFRNREAHLRIFLNHMHPILQRQQLDYTIFVVEQQGNEPYNKGMLMNIGYRETKKLQPYDCFIFHDVDHLLLNDRNLYLCDKSPSHLAVGVDKSNYTLIYPQMMGGASAFTDEQYLRLNGHSNSYWGWGAEDDDIAKRIELSGFNIHRPATDIALYKTIKHTHEVSSESQIRHFLLGRTFQRFKHDGLNSLSYRLLDFQCRELYTWLLVDVGVKPRDTVLIKGYKR